MRSGKLTKKQARYKKDPNPRNESVSDYVQRRVIEAQIREQRRKEKEEAENRCVDSPTLLHSWEIMPTLGKNPKWKRQCIICAKVRNIDTVRHANKSGFDVRINGSTKKLKS